MSNQADSAGARSPVKQALLALEKMQAKLDSVERARTEPIALIGMGCRFPGGGNDPESFWRLLRDGVDTITHASASRWSATELVKLHADGLSSAGWGAFLDQVDRFDPSFFGISGREAAGMDPQQRLLLEVAWEALERAGQAPDRLAGTPTGVFVGICSSEYAWHHFSNRDQIDAYASTGTAYSLVANRLSYLLDLQGPSMAIDTACSSSLVAVHLACQSLRSGECRLALAGGVNLTLFPEGAISLAKWGMLAADGRCKTFDARADGYVRGEGCGVVVLKRLSDALADGDPILALIRGSAVNQDGRSAGLTAPNLLAQQTVIRQALANAGVTPDQIGYVEAHGTGTTLGDPIEVEALTEVIGQPRPDGRRCLIASVKTNIGHLEAAAGIAGLIKVALCFQHAEIPPHLHFNELNPNISLDNTPFVIPTQRTPWPAGQQPRRAGLSSFGFGGTNAHVVLEEPPPSVVPAGLAERPLQLLTLSAGSTIALQAIAESYEQLLAAPAAPNWPDVCFSANTGRMHFPHRLALAAPTPEAARDQLAAFRAGQPAAGLVSGLVQSKSRPKVAFLFTGQGSQYIGMGRQLYATQPIFRAALDRCAELLMPQLGLDLRDVLYPAQESGVRSQESDNGQSVQNPKRPEGTRIQNGEAPIPNPIDQTWLTQPALFALEYALAALWRAWGVEPALLLGHSLGELVAACVAGVFSLEDGLRLVAARGRLMQLAPPGAMAAIFADEAHVRAALAPMGDRVVIAALNGPTETVIAGEIEAVAAVVAQLGAAGIRTRSLPGRIAFHSPLMAAAQTPFAAEAAGVYYAPARLGMVANVTGRLAEVGQLSQPEYWVRQLREPVRFAAGLETLRSQGVNLLIEIGPQPTLLGIQQHAQTDAQIVGLPSLRSGVADWEQLLSSLSRYYIRGGRVDWGAFDRDYPRSRVLLPTYPFQRARYWLDRPEAEPAPAEDRTPRASVAEPGAAVVPPDWLYRLHWQLVTPAASRPAPDRWLILADRQGVGAALAEQLRRTGTPVIEVSMAEAAGNGRASDPGAEVLAADDGAGLRSLIGRLLVAGGSACWGVVHLWGLDTADEPSSSAALEAALATSCGSALNLAQALVATSGASARLWLVTRGAQAVADGEASSLAQAALWGLGRVYAHEQPAHWGGLVDLDPSASPAATAAALAAVLTAAPHEDQLALRGTQTYGLRLTRYTPEAAAHMILDEAGSYLITGGLGGLGWAVVADLAARGARHLVVLGRRAPTAPQQAQLDALVAAGTQIQVLQGDVTEAADVARALGVARESGALRGIIHCAGVLDDGVLLRQTWERWARVLAPKVLGGWHLHQQTAGDRLDFFVLFGSVAGVLGAPGQSNYAAANVFLDGLAALRRSQGLAGLSIDWGPWAEAGMGRGRRTIAGIGAIGPAAGLAALAQLAGQPMAQIVVLPANWAEFMQTLPRGAEPALLAELLAGSRMDDQLPARPAILERMAQAAPARQRELLQAYLQREVARVLGLDPAAPVEPQQGFFELGMDSLMAIELRNGLQASLGLPALPATLIFDYPTIDNLAGYLSGELFERGPAAPDMPVRPATTEPIAIIGMSCRFPGGADSPDAFWRLLRDGVDGITEVPPDRWDVNAYYDPDPEAPGKTYSRHGGFLRHVDQFDPQFFGISPREAISMDPQQRLLLEVSWEALERAGQVPGQLLGSPTGVFVGIGSNDYAQVHMQSADPAWDPLESTCRHASLSIL